MQSFAPRVLRLAAFLDGRAVRGILWALLVAQGAVAVWLSQPWVFGDNSHYLVLSDNIASGRYGSVGVAGFEPDALRPPGYPVLLWLLRHVLHLPIVGVIILQLGAYLLAIYVLTRLLDRRGYNSSLLLLLTAAYPAATMYGTNIVAEAWTMLALVFAVLALETRPASPRAYMAAGLIAALAAYLRSDLLLVPLFIAGWVFVRELRSGTPVGRSIGLGTLPALTATALLLPYAAYNQTHFKWPLPTPVAGAVGPSLYLATWQEKLPPEDIQAFYNGIATPRAEAQGLAREVRSINRSLGVDDLHAPWVPGNYPTNPIRIESAKLTMALAFKRIAGDPEGYARHVAKNLWRLWHGSAYPSAVPVWAASMIKIASWLIFFLGSVGAVASFIKPRGWPLSAAPAVILLSIPLVHVWLHTEARYTASVRPLLLLLAATTLGWLLRAYVARRAPDCHNEFKR